MLFNSSIFLIFFVVVYTLYLLSQKRLEVQNVILLVASYIFYAYWDWRFLSLLLACSIVFNLTLLGFFKYFNFFADSFVDVLNLLNMEADSVTLDIILPAGISFYTFQEMDYTFDVYRKELKPTQSLINFALFVTFFPHLVAGPIMWAGSLLSQVAQPRRITIEQINGGLFLILWGYFKKVVIADNVAVIANLIFNNRYSWSKSCSM